MNKLKLVLDLSNKEKKDVININEEVFKFSKREKTNISSSLFVMIGDAIETNSKVYKIATIQKTKDDTPIFKEIK